APTKPSTTLRSFLAYTAGMPCTWKACDTPGFSSTLTFTSSTWPPVASMTFSMIGPRVRHGPHHGAHRSITTGTVSDRSSTSASNVASVRSILQATIGRFHAFTSRGSVRIGFADHRRGGLVSQEGIDAEKVTSWLAERADVDPPLEFHLITGGHSNL